MNASAKKWDAEDKSLQDIKVKVRKWCCQGLGLGLQNNTTIISCFLYICVLWCITSQIQASGMILLTEQCWLRAWRVLWWWAHGRSGLQYEGRHFCSCPHNRYQLLRHTHAHHNINHIMIIFLVGNKKHVLSPFCMRAWEQENLPWVAAMWRGVLPSLLCIGEGHAGTKKMHLQYRNVKSHYLYPHYSSVLLRGLLLIMSPIIFSYGQRGHFGLFASGVAWY